MVEKRAVDDGPHIVQFSCEILQLNNLESRNPLRSGDIKKLVLT